MLVCFGFHRDLLTYLPCFAEVGTVFGWADVLPVDICLEISAEPKSPLLADLHHLHRIVGEACTKQLGCTAHEENNPVRSLRVQTRLFKQEVNLDLWRTVASAALPKISSAAQSSSRPVGHSGPFGAI